MKISGIFGKKPEAMYTEADLVSFGLFLLSVGRERKIRKYTSDKSLAADKVRMVHDADVSNWKHTKGK
jgi:hypothetical protein